MSVIEVHRHYHGLGPEGEIESKERAKQFGCKFRIITFGI
jgi:hypothetical protein